MSSRFIYVVPCGGFRFRNGATLFKFLDTAHVKWRMYAGDRFPVPAELDGVSVVTDREEFEDFAKDLRDPSFDAGFVLIEPNYNVVTLGEPFAGGDSQHPSGGVAAGERLIKATYEAIRSSPVWKNSLLIITWDEHGGFYDHIPPPPAPKTGDRGRRHGFVFDQLGPRVPAVVVSPLIPRNLIEHRVFDHTAVAATIRRIFKLPQFDERDGISGGLDHLVRLKAPRTDAPIKLPDAKPSAVPIAPLRPDAPLFDDAGLQAAILHAALVQHLQLVPPEQHPAIIARFGTLRTRADGVAYLAEVEQLVREKRKQAPNRSAVGRSVGA